MYNIYKINNNWIIFFKMSLRNVGIVVFYSFKNCIKVY